MLKPRVITDGITLRPLTHDDAAGLTAAYQRNRAHLADWEPTRRDDYFTLEQQTAGVEASLRAQTAGQALSLVLEEGVQIIGRLNINSIERGAFQNCRLGYWIAADRQGNGLMTAAVGAVTEITRDELNLHRIEAGVLTHNLASQRVLVANGFTRFGLATRYLKIAGRWQDHIMFQRILDPATGTV